MSSARWPAGKLRDALVRAHRIYPTATAPQLAREVGCEPGCARVILRAAGLTVPKAKDTVHWTPEMKRALIDAAHHHMPVDRISERLGVADATLVRGAMEVIRDLSR